MNVCNYDYKNQLINSYYNSNYEIYSIKNNKNNILLFFY